MPGLLHHPGSALLALAVCCLPTLAAPPQTTYDLTAQPEPEARFRAILEVEGRIEGANDQRIPMEVEAELVFHERVLTAPSGELRAVRLYDKAEATVTIDDKSLSRQLPADRRTIVYDRQDTAAALWCPTDSLTRDELELIDLPAQTTELYRLLPEQRVAVGQSWKVPTEGLCRILHVDGIVAGELEGQLVSVDDELAKIDLTGKLEGNDGGVKLGMQLRGKLNVDLRQHAIRWLALGIGENRQSSPTGPSVRLQARLRVVQGPGESPIELSQANLEALALDRRNSEDGALLLQFQPDPPTFQMLHDRSWYPISQSTGPIILRSVADAKVVAQCTISPLHKLPAGEELALEEFRRDIQQALGRMFERIVDTEVAETPDEIRVMRVDVAGQVGTVPMHWIYYHLSDSQGNRCAMVFTLETAAFERFGGSDVTMVESFRFGDTPSRTARTAPQTDSSTR